MYIIINFWNYINCIDNIKQRIRLVTYFSNRQNIIFVNINFSLLAISVQNVCQIYGTAKAAAAALSPVRARSLIVMPRFCKKRRKYQLQARSRRRFNYLAIVPPFAWRSGTAVSIYISLGEILHLFYKIPR